MTKKKRLFPGMMHNSAVLFRRTARNANLAAVALLSFALELFILIMYYIFSITSNIPLYLSVILSVLGVTAMVYHLKNTVK